MKKLTLLPILLLASLQLNGAFSRLGQAGRQLAPMLRGKLNTQSMHLPATMQKTCPAGMRLLSSSSRSQSGYGYARGQQQTGFGGREALLLGGALAGATYHNIPEEYKLKHAHAAELESREPGLQKTRPQDRENWRKKIELMLAEKQDISSEIPKVIGDLESFYHNGVIQDIFDTYPTSRDAIVQTLIDNPHLEERMARVQYYNKHLKLQLQISKEEARALLPLVIKNLAEQRPGVMTLLKYQHNLEQEFNEFVKNNATDPKHISIFAAAYNNEIPEFDAFRKFIGEKSLFRISAHARHKKINETIIPLIGKITTMLDNDEDVTSEISQFINQAASISWWADDNTHSLSLLDRIIASPHLSKVIDSLPDIVKTIYRFKDDYQARTARIDFLNVCYDRYSQLRAPIIQILSDDPSWNRWYMDSLKIFWHTPERFHRTMPLVIKNLAEQRLGADAILNEALRNDNSETLIGQELVDACAEDPQLVVQLARTYNNSEFRNFRKLIKEYGNPDWDKSYALFRKGSIEAYIDTQSFSHAWGFSRTKVNQLFHTIKEEAARQTIEDTTSSTQVQE